MVLIHISLAISDAVAVTSFEKCPFFLCVNVLCPSQNGMICFSVVKLYIFLLSLVVFINSSSGT